MMPEEIRPASINRPRRVRSLSREEREERGENRGRFTRDLAALAHDDLAGGREGAHPAPQPVQEEPDTPTEPARTDGTEDDAAPPGLGRNLDITT
jgi:hypothetical protein